MCGNDERGLVQSFRHESGDVAGDGRGGREAGGFDTDELDGLRDVGVTRDDEIGDASSGWRNELGTQTRVAQL